MHLYLKEIQYFATIPPSCGEGAFRHVSNACVLKVPEGDIEAYKAADGWKDFLNVVALDNDPSAIGDIQSVSNAVPVEYIGTNGYRNAKAMKGVNIIRMSDDSVRKVVAK